MKRKNTRFCVTIMLLLFFCSACKKEATEQPSSQKNNYVIAINNGNKNEQNLAIVMSLGHDARTCRGCVLVNGYLTHFDCQGNGNACSVSSNVTLYVGGSDLYAVTTDTFGLTDQSYFNMPARSLSTEDEKGQPVYLNIPAQLVYRDSSTLQFTFTGLYYTTNAAYSND